jgi:3-oxoacyl-[acyl-carrier-protein] synthase II
MNEKVVITGTGLVSSLGNTAPETWDALLSGKCGMRQIKDFNASGFECSNAAQVRGLGPEELDVHPRDSRIMDKHSYMLLKATRDAFKNAGLDSNSVPREDIGYFAAMGMVDYDINNLLPAVIKSRDTENSFNYDEFYLQGYNNIYPLWLLSMLNNISFCQVAIDLGIKGENTVFSPHADSCIHAITEACNSVADKKAKVVLAGGVSEKVSPLSIARASLFDILNNKDASCSPFSKDRNGTVLGEGCGIITIELLSSAEERQVRPLAAIAGYGASFEKSEESNCPTPEAFSLSMEQAIARAEINPSDIDLIITHGDGTPVGDRSEIKAIHRTFAKNLDQITAYSSKGNLGHLLSGAPGVDVVLGIYMLINGIIPATCTALPLEEDIMFNVVVKNPLSTNPRRIMINSQSYEGQCASLIIEAVH